MAFGDNSVLITTAGVNNVVANNESDVYSGTGGAYAFVVANGDVGDDVFESFGADDSIITSKKIYDGNGDGYISFGDNNTLDIDRYGSGDAKKGNDNISVSGPAGPDDLISIIRFLGTKGGQYVYADAGTRDDLLGHFTKGFDNSAGGSGGDSSVSAFSIRIDNDVSSNASIDFSKGATALLTDNALGLNFGGDTLTGFGRDDVLIFTSKILDKNNDDVITFGKNGVMDLSGADGPDNTDPAGGPGGQFDIEGRVSVTYLGEKTINDTTYYYYGSKAQLGTLDGVSLHHDA